jgi:UDP-3-O-[3-hydroxymyristoyl] glucosamine N-acyltransferase
MEITLTEIAKIAGGTIVGNAETVITGVAPIEDSEPGDLTFLANKKYACHIETTRASAILCGPGTVDHGKTLLVVDNPYLAYAKLAGMFFPPKKEAGVVDERAVLGSNVSLGKGVSIYPFVFIGDNCTIEDNVTLYPFCFLGDNVSVGEGTLVYPNVTIREQCRIGKRVIVHSGTVIGSDGFGYAKDGARYHKIPQLGIVQIDDDVEIGANTTIDRAAIDRTWIKRGTKIDNLVRIAHNVVVGEDSVVVSQVGISGSTQLGDRVTMAGKSAAIGHLKIGDDVIVGARGSVTSDVAPGQVVSGTPAIPHKTFLKATSTFSKLPEMRRRLSELEKTVAGLKLYINQEGSYAAEN